MARKFYHPKVLPSENITITILHRNFTCHLSRYQAVSKGISSSNSPSSRFIASMRIPKFCLCYFPLSYYRIIPLSFFMPSFTVTLSFYTAFSSTRGQSLRSKMAFLRVKRCDQKDFLGASPLLTWVCVIRFCLLQ